MRISDISIASRIQALSFALILIGAATALVGIWKMDKIGTEITEIAEQDIPLTEIVTKITIHQLEQAVLLEKGLAHAGEDDVADIGASFAALGGKLDAEVKEARIMVSDAIAKAHTSAAKAEFERLATVLAEIEEQHASYEKRGEEMFARLIANDLTGAKATLRVAEREQDELSRELTGALTQLEAFTKASAKKAEQDEQLGIRLLIGVAVAGLVLGIGLAFVIGRSVSAPVKSLTSTMDRLADNDLEVDVRFTENKDEVGAMARAVQVFKDNAIEMRRLRAEQEKAEKKAAEDRKALLASVADQINEGIGEIAGKLFSVADNVKTSAISLTSQADQTSKQSTDVASASEQASTNVQTVASAAEELAASVTEISRQVARSKEIAGHAVTEVDNTNVKVNGLSEAADKIGEVIALISEIADQTNLLALNATIEAARAGDAGKGFAVVASEVKNLANQTAKATDDISSQVVEIQTATREAVDAILSIGKVIDEISEVTNGIAAATEEQSAATQEIARNVEEAATGTQVVNQNISDVAKAAEATGSSAGVLLETSETLGQDASVLKREVVELVEKIKAA